MNRLAAYHKVLDGFAITINGLLTPSQSQRLSEINVQIQGTNILLEPEMQKTFNLTEAQVKQVNDLQAKNVEANKAVMAKVQSGEVNRSEIRSLMQKSGDALKAVLEHVLTDSQKAQLKKMGGAPFIKDPNYNPQNSGGRGVGFGGAFSQTWQDQIFLGPFCA
jgi:hypothetical protein